MAKPNYAFQKRQRELAKKQKKEEKRLRKAEPGSANDEPGLAQDEGVATAIPVSPGEAPAQPANGGDSKA
ncbi:MAG TPA: hypothetical protein VGE10_10915 [Zeimonas sp.]